MTNGKQDEVKCRLANFQKLLQGFKRGNVFPETLPRSYNANQGFPSECLLSLISQHPSFPAPFAGCGGFSAMPAAKPGCAGAPTPVSSHARAFSWLHPASASFDSPQGKGRIPMHHLLEKELA